MNDTCHLSHLVVASSSIYTRNPLISPYEHHTKTYVCRRKLIRKCIADKKIRTTKTNTNINKFVSFISFAI